MKFYCGHSVTVNGCPGQGHTELACWLLGQVKDCSPDVVDDSGWSGLVIAASAGHTELVRLLLEAGAEINHRTDQGRTALLYAASKVR